MYASNLLSINILYDILLVKKSDAGLKQNKPCWSISSLNFALKTCTRAEAFVKFCREK